MRFISSRTVAAAIAAALLCDTPGAATPAHRESYLITFVERGLLHYIGDIAGFAATRPASNGQRKLRTDNAAARAYAGYLGDKRDEHLQAIHAALGRAPEVSHSYAITMNGLAAELTAAEAAQVAATPGVARVRRAGVEQVQTYRGPRFIGADAIWDGSAAPFGLGTRGEGTVVGVIDTGVSGAHPSFADDASCGFGATQPKLLSSVDCGSSADGVCNGPNAEANDGYGHGVHTASTAAGNTLDGSVVPAPLLPPPYAAMSGVAPCAQLRTYKVCATNSCEGAAIVAGIENAIADGVDVINFSISGGTSPWEDADGLFLDAVEAGIFVAASAGNTGDSVPNPVGQVNHIGPWVLTVAAATHDLNAVGNGALSVTGPGMPPAALQDIALVPGSGVDAGAAASAPLRFDAANPFGCDAFPGGYFDAAIALISRGDCSFEQKIDNAAAAGARLAVVYNNEAGELGMSVGAAQLPAYGITATAGAALVSFIGNAGTAPTQTAFTPAVRRADVLADFSLRGPASFTTTELTKPDIAGPGVNIYAATDPASGQYQYLSGTSMASPHLAGAAALLHALHPGWTPSELKSAMQTTAVVEGYKDDAFSPWDSDDVGSGRVDLRRAASAKLVLDETPERYRAADPAGGTLDVRELNLPSLRNTQCSPNCTFTRIVTNRSGAAGTWNAAVEPSSGGFEANVTPAQFSLADGASQTLTITAQPDYGTTMQAIGFGRVVLDDATDPMATQHLSLAIRGEGQRNYVAADTAAVAIEDRCAAGASNGIAEPGETVRIAVPLRARGGDFGNVHAQLPLPAPPGVGYLVAQASVGDLSLGDVATANFEIKLDAGLTCLSQIELPLSVGSDQGEYVTRIELPVGRDRWMPADLPRAIPDGDANGTASILDVPQDLVLSTLGVRVVLDHGWVGDLTVKLKSPAGTEVTLLDQPGVPERGSFGCGNRNIDVTFVDGAADPEGVCADGDGMTWPVAEAAPVQPLAGFAGESARGTWTLTVIDHTNGYPGRIAHWELRPAPAFEPICAVCVDPIGDRVFEDGFDAFAP